MTDPRKSAIARYVAEDAALRAFERRALLFDRIRRWLPAGLSLIGTLALLVFMVVDRGADENGGGGWASPGSDNSGGWLAWLAFMAVAVAGMCAIAGLGLVAAAYWNRRKRRPNTVSREAALADSVWANVVSAHRRGESPR